MTLKIEIDMTALSKGVGRAMDYWVENAKLICPKRKWNMKKSIGKIVEQSLNGFKGIITTRHNLLEAPPSKKYPKGFHYPFTVHEGSTKINVKARPFFKWSYKNMKSKMDKVILDGVKLK